MISWRHSTRYPPECLQKWMKQTEVYSWRLCIFTLCSGNKKSPQKNHKYIKNKQKSALSSKLNCHFPSGNFRTQDDLSMFQTACTQTATLLHFILVNFFYITHAPHSVFIGQSDGTQNNKLKKLRTYLSYFQFPVVIERENAVLSSATRYS